MTRREVIDALDDEQVLRLAAVLRRRGHRRLPTRAEADEMLLRDILDSGPRRSVLAGRQISDQCLDGRR